MNPTHFFLHGEVRVNYIIKQFAALDAWEIGLIAKEIVKSDDPVKRRAFANRLLAQVTIQQGEGEGEGEDLTEFDLDTEDAIDRHLKFGKTVDEVVNRVLEFNGLDTLEMLETRVDPWSDTGSRMAASFMAEASRLMKPILSQ